MSLSFIEITLPYSFMCHAIYDQVLRTKDTEIKKHDPSPVTKKT